MSATPTLPRRVGWALGTGTIVQGFNSSIIAVALVTISLSFDDVSALPWLVSGMYIACSVASPIAGRLVDAFGARRLFIIGLGVVLAAALCGPFVPSIAWLVVVRIVMGIGASMQFPAAMVIIRSLADARSASPKTVIGIVSLCGQTISALGPSIGGILVSAFGWSSIFWVNVPLVTLSALVVNTLLPAGAGAPKPRPAAVEKPGMLQVLQGMDIVGLLLFVAVLITLMIGLLDLSAIPHGDIRPVLWIVGAVVLCILLVLFERRTRRPFIDVRLFARHPNILLTCGRVIVTYVAFYCVYYGLPQWLESGRGLTPAGAGALMIATFSTAVLGTIALTLWGARLSAWTMLVIGGAVMIVASAAAALLMNTQTPIPLLVLLCAGLGLPNGFNTIGNQTILTVSAPPEAVGVASGMFRTAQYVGATISAAIVTLAFGGRDGRGIETLSAVVIVVGVALTGFAIVGRAHRRSTT